MNDGTIGTNNNVWFQDVEVMALGVRVVVENTDGRYRDQPTRSAKRTLKSTLMFATIQVSPYRCPYFTKERERSVHFHQPRSKFRFPEETISSCQVRTCGLGRFNETPTFLLAEQGEDGANKSIELRLEDIDADLTTDPSNPRYVRAGTYVLEITARYETQPTVAHTQRITIVVEQIDQVQVVAAGTSVLKPFPGGSSVFSISVRNTGNALRSTASTACRSNAGR